MKKLLALVLIISCSVLCFSQEYKFWVDNIPISHLYSKQITNEFGHHKERIVIIIEDKYHSKITSLFQSTQLKDDKEIFILSDEKLDKSMFIRDQYRDLGSTYKFEDLFGDRKPLKRYGDFMHVAYVKNLVDSTYNERMKREKKVALDSIAIYPYDGNKFLISKQHFELVKKSIPDKLFEPYYNSNRSLDSYFMILEDIEDKVLFEYDPNYKNDRIREKLHLIFRSWSIDDDFLKKARLSYSEFYNFLNKNYKRNIDTQNRVKEGQRKIKESQRRAEEEAKRPRAIIIY